MLKILGIMGSPRKCGNTHTLMKAVADGVNQAGAEMEICLLKEYVVNECDGCHVCWQGKACSKKDDMNRLFEEIKSSDALVFGTPIYWYGPTAILKAFIDRFVYFNCDENRPYIMGKPAAIVVPYEETNSDAAAPVVTFFEKSLAYLQMPLWGKVLAPGVTKRGEVKACSGVMDEAQALGRHLIEGLLDK